MLCAECAVRCAGSEVGHSGALCSGRMRDPVPPLCCRAPRCARSFAALCAARVLGTMRVSLRGHSAVCMRRQHVYPLCRQAARTVCCLHALVMLASLANRAARPSDWTASAFPLGKRCGLAQALVLSPFGCSAVCTPVC